MHKSVNWLFPELYAGRISQPGPARSQVYSIFLYFQIRGIVLYVRASMDENAYNAKMYVNILRSND